MQETFLFPQKNEFLFEDFVFLPENNSANQVLTNFFTQTDFNSDKLPNLILQGSKFSGKTHLLNIFAQKVGAKFLKKTEINKENLVKTLQENHFYIFEDIDEISDDELLFHLINSAIEAKSFLVFSLKDFTNFKLKDLVSRLKNIFICKIEKLQQDSLEILVNNYLARRQIKLSKSAINLICQNCAANYLDIFTKINKIENFCHQNKGEILLKDLREILN